MWQVTKLLFTLALVFQSEAMPKEFYSLPVKVSSTPRITVDRLNTEVTPTNYKIELTVSEDNINNKNYSGTATIAITVASEISSFQIHSKKLDIDTITLKATGFTGKITLDGPNLDTDILTLTSDAPINAGDYVLTIVYVGHLSETDMDGFYLSTFLDADGTQHKMASTQFEQMGARRAFPCFDEPALKATFDISITYTDGYTALSNKAPNATTAPKTNNLKTTTFKTTPIMSTYLVAFIVAQYTCLDGLPTTDKIPTQICARPGIDATMEVAKATAPLALNQMSDYTGVKYSEMGVEKMTQAAIPDFAVRAMENWGMVTYREADILFNKNESSNYYEQTVVTVITHEFAHQWFGDKITLNWWGDVFLNEGFATYFEYHAADLIKPGWELQKQFVIEQLQSVLVSDSVNTSLPLSLPTTIINDLDVINSRFDSISYNKGGTILRMAHHFLGLDNFKLGLTKYLTDAEAAGKIGTPDLLWQSFEDFAPKDEPQKLPDTVQNVMDNWTKKGGYPVLTLALGPDGDTVTVSQERFLLNEEHQDKTKWYVPITYTVSNDTSNFANTATQAWLKTDSDLNITLNAAEWIILNNQQVGYYRVNYDDTLLGKISTALAANLTGIDEMSRSQIVDDQLNFARAGLKDYGTVLGFLNFMKLETSYYTWTSAFNGYNYLLQRTVDTTVQTALKTYISQQMVELLKAVPLATLHPDQQIYTLNQALAWTWACKLGDNSCIAESKTSFANFKTNSTDSAKKVNRNFRSFVYCNALRNSANASADFDFLYKQYTESSLATEKVTILKALGCVNDATIRKEYLKKALSDEVRLQDVTYVFSSVYANNADGPNDVLTFIQENYADFETHTGTKSTLTGLINSVANMFTTQAQIDTLIAFATTADLAEKYQTAVTGAVENANKNLETITKVEDSLKTYFSLVTTTATNTDTTTDTTTATNTDTTTDTTGSAIINNNSLVNLALILVAYLFFSV